MKKTFEQLTVGDKVYMAWIGGVVYDSCEVMKVEAGEIRFNHSTFKRFDSFGIKDSNRMYYTSESDIIRYCKGQSIKHINSLIDSAKKTIQAIKDFKESHYDSLNINWTESEINKLENALKRH